MSQYSNNIVSFCYKTSLARVIVGLARVITTLALGLVFGTTTSFAATTYQTKLANAPTHMLKTDLSALANRTHITLDWANPTFTLNFDLPQHEWYDGLDLSLSMYPQGDVDPATPIYISYNGSKPVALNGRGSEFDAQIKLDANLIRPSQNNLVVSFRAPQGSDCLTAAHGQWIVDMTKSKLTARARTKPNALKISDVRQQLAHSMTAPKRVAILAKGANKAAYEALIAQGIAQRVNNIPNFQFTQKRADLTLIVGTRDQLRSRVKEKLWLDTQGTLIFVDTRRSTTLVLTANTDEQLLELTRAFARYELPASERPLVTLQELYASQPFANTTLITHPVTPLTQIGETTFARSWRPDAAKLSFNVNNPKQTSGILTLNIIPDPSLDAQSKLKVALNGQPIGYTYLDKKEKNVAFDIRQGQLKPTQNEITITPVYAPPVEGNICATLDNRPALLVSHKSKLKLSTSGSQGELNLLDFAANGFPFTQTPRQAQRQAQTQTQNNSTIVLTARSTRNRSETLKFLAFAAQKFGPQWADAHYMDHFPATDQERDSNILIIGPKAFSDAQLLAAAPSTLRNASSINRVKQAQIGRGQQASLGADQAFALAAQSQNTQITNTAANITGGFATLFASPYADGRFIGIISSDTTKQFPAAIRTLSSARYWNALQGSVSRWNSRDIFMAQAAAATTYSATNNIALHQPKKFSKINALWSRFFKPSNSAQHGTTTSDTQTNTRTEAINTPVQRVASSSRPSVENISARLETASLKTQQIAHKAHVNMTRKMTSLSANAKKGSFQQKLMRSITSINPLFFIALVLLLAYLISSASPRSSRPR
jgi:hypothetical protein